MRARGFTLIELLLAMTVVAVLAALLLAGFSSLSVSAALSAAVGTLSDVMSEGRQEAITQNTPVEVRLYDVPSTTSAAPAYRALQLHWVQADGTRPAVSSVIFLPPTIQMDATAAHSPLIAANPVTATADPNDPNMNTQTRVFHFLPDGSTDLPAGSSWFVTLRAATQSDPANFPANWASVTLDPATGRAQIFRP